MYENEILHGIRIGRHEFNPEKVMDWIDKNVIPYGLNFLRFNVKGVKTEPDNFFKWAKYLSDNKIYFAFIFDKFIIYLNRMSSLILAFC